MPIDPRRVARLEDAVKALHQQVNVLISEVRLLATQAAAETGPATPPPVVAPEQPLPPSRPMPVAPVAPLGSPADQPAAARAPLPPIANTPRHTADAAPVAQQPPLVPPAVPPRVPPNVRPAGPPRVPPAPPRRPSGGAIPIGSPNGMSLETLIGRYGMIGGAVLLLLMGIGTFISWAIANNVITPVGRVGLGALGAIAFVVAGFTLRNRGEKRFGSVLLAVALAITHTVAWGAGPKLHIIDEHVALGLAALASVALAALALADEDETLFVVGVGGALLAPFVTASGRASGPLTLMYGWMVITAGLFAMRGHAWRVASRMMTLAGVVYAGVGLVGATFSQTSDRMAPPFFTLACTWSAALLASVEYRAMLVRSYMTTMAIAMLTAAIALVASGVHPVDVAPLALAGTVSLYLIQRPLSIQPEQWLLDAVALPLALLAAALIANGGIDAPNGVAITLIWGVAAAGAALMNEQERRGPHYLVFGLTTLFSVAYMLRHETLLLGLALVAHAVALVFLLRKERARLVAIPITIGLIIAMSQARDLLVVRPTYIGNPFVNPGALLLLLTILGWWRFFDAMATVAVENDEPDQGWRALTRVFLPVALFMWGWYELGSTVSHDVATSLVTLYFAIVGVGAIHYGRIRSVPVSRHVGLGLCVVAAGMAISRVWGLGDIGIKAGTFVLVSLFMLGVAYWYRQAGEEEEA
jgi:uncharacterized membrane protein